MSATDRDRVVESVRRFFAVPPSDTVAVYVFGSFGRDTATETSDVDVAVLFARNPARTLDGLCSDLQDRLQEALNRRVDIVVLNHASADLVHRVLRDGVLVCETNPGARIAFEIRSRNDYFDLEPIRQRYRHPSAPGIASP